MKVALGAHPLNLLKDLQSLVKEIRSIASEANAYIKEEEGRPLAHVKGKPEKFEYLRFSSKHEGLDFNFILKSISLYKQTNTKTESRFLFVQTPMDGDSIQSATSWLNKIDFANQFKSWVDLVKDTADLNFDDPIEKNYAEEFYKNFKILDDDADEVPFDTLQQIAILKYLDKVQAYLESKSNDHGVDGVVAEIETFRSDVTRISKNESMKRFSKIFAKSKLLSIFLLHELVRVFREDLLEKGIGKGYEYLESIIKALGAV